MPFRYRLSPFVDHSETHLQQEYAAWKGESPQQAWDPLWHFFPRATLNSPIHHWLIDIGASFGTHAGSFARQGYKVIAVEPAYGARKLGKKVNHHPHITWIDDALPDLQSVQKTKIKFDVATLSSVWAYLNPEDQRKSLKTLAGLIKTNGIAAISFAHTYSLAQRFAANRIKTITELSKECGFKVVSVVRNKPLKHMPNTRSDFVLLRRQRTPSVTARA